MITNLNLTPIPIGLCEINIRYACVYASFSPPTLVPLPTFHETFLSRELRILPTIVVKLILKLYFYFRNSLCVFALKVNDENEGIL